MEKLTWTEIFDYLDFPSPYWHPFDMVAPCTITGDSIAVGLYPHLPCHMAYSKIGATTKTITQNAGPALGTMIISAGSNDWKPSESSFESLRQKYEGRPVIWVLPGPKFQEAREMIMNVAKKWGDTVLHLQGVGKDGVHPSGKGYKDSAMILRTAPSYDDSKVTFNQTKQNG